jgi:hypothetical protein
MDRRFASSVQFTSAYTWSHAIDEVSDLFDLAGSRALPQNSFNLHAEKGDANFDVRHRFSGSAIWEIPWLSGNPWLGGWQLAGIVTLDSGRPFTVLGGFDVNLDGNLTDRLNTTRGISEVDDGRIRLRFPEGALALRQLLAEVGQDGSVARNSFRAQGVASVDLAVSKHFRFSERTDVELRADVFNLFNRTHYGIPVHQLGSPSLGSAVDTRLPQRTVQVGARVRF